MTCIAYFATKTALREAVKLNPQKVTISDPSIFNPRTFVATDLRPGETVVVTNHPKRSWFAQVGRTAKGELFVK